MTTKSIDNKIFALKLYCRGVSHEKQRFWTIFLSAPQAPPLKANIYFYCRLAVSDFRSILCCCAGPASFFPFVVGTFLLFPALRFAP